MALESYLLLYSVRASVAECVVVRKVDFDSWTVL